MSVSRPARAAAVALRARRAAATGFGGSTACGLHHERRCLRASLSSHAELWEPTGMLERTHVAGMCKTQGLRPGDGP